MKRTQGNKDSGKSELILSSSSGSTSNNSCSSITDQTSALEKIIDKIPNEENRRIFEILHRPSDVKEVKEELKLLRKNQIKQAENILGCFIQGNEVELYGRLFNLLESKVNQNYLTDGITPTKSKEDRESPPAEGLLDNLGERKQTKEVDELAKSEAALALNSGSDARPITSSYPLESSWNQEINNSVASQVGSISSTGRLRPITARNQASLNSTAGKLSAALNTIQDDIETPKIFQGKLGICDIGRYDLSSGQISRHLKKQVRVYKIKEIRKQRKYKIKAEKKQKNFRINSYTIFHLGRLEEHNEQEKNRNINHIAKNEKIKYLKVKIHKNFSIDILKKKFHEFKEKILCLQFDLLFKTLSKKDLFSLIDFFPYLLDLKCSNFSSMPQLRKIILKRQKSFIKSEAIKCSEACFLFVLDELIKHFDINYTIDKWTLLHYAVYRKSFLATQYLLKHKADPLVKNDQSELPLHIAAQKDCIEILEILIKNSNKELLGQHVDDKDEQKNTPLSYAVKMSNFDAVKLLLECRANPNVQLGSNQNILDLACSNKKFDICGMLLSKGAKPTKKISDLSEAEKKQIQLFKEKFQQLPYVDPLHFLISRTTTVPKSFGSMKNQVGSIFNSENSSTDTLISPFMSSDTAMLPTTSVGGTIPGYWVGKAQEDRESRPAEGLFDNLGERKQSKEVDELAKSEILKHLTILNSSSSSLNPCATAAPLALNSGSDARPITSSYPLESSWNQSFSNPPDYLLFYDKNDRQFSTSIYMDLLGQNANFHLSKYTSLILEIAPYCSNLSIVIDMDNDSADVHDITIPEGSKGNYHPETQSITLGGKRQYKELRGTIIHELCHMVCDIVWNNERNPYFKDSIEQEKFNKICDKICEHVKKGNKIHYLIDSVFDYPPNKYQRELIVRVPQIIAAEEQLGLDFLKKQVPELFKFFDEIFLSSCQDYLIPSFRLRRHYLINCKINTLFNNNQELPVSKFPVSLVNTSGSGKIEKHTANNLFSILKEQHKILLVGEAGMGKSTIATYLLLEWAAKPEWQKRFDWVLLVRLGNLNNIFYAPKEKLYTAIDLVAKECLPKDDILEKILRKNLNSNQVLWVLDGYDELIDPLPDHLKNVLESILKENNVCITSRPCSLLENLKEMQTYRIDGFSEKIVKKYVKYFFNEKDEKIMKFINKVEILKLACSPINLEIICNIWQKDTKRFEEDTQTGLFTITDLYCKIVKWLFYRFLEKKGYQTSELQDERRVSRRLNQEIEALEEISFSMLTKGRTRYSATKEEITTWVTILKQDDGFLKDIIDIGLISTKSTLNEQHAANISSDDSNNHIVDVRHIVRRKQQEDKFEFIHPSFQEFFAARYIAMQFGKKSKENIETVSAFLKGKKYDNLLVCQFACGLFESKQQFDLFWSAVNLFKEATKVKHIIFLLNCLNQLKDDQLKKFITLEGLKSLLDSAKSNINSVSSIIRERLIICFKNNSQLFIVFPQLITELYQLLEGSGFEKVISHLAHASNSSNNKEIIDILKRIILEIKFTEKEGVDIFKGVITALKQSNKFSTWLLEEASVTKDKFIKRRLFYAIYLQALNKEDIIDLLIKRATEDGDNLIREYSIRTLHKIGNFDLKITNTLLAISKKDSEELKIKKIAGEAYRYLDNEYCNSQYSQDMDDDYCGDGPSPIQSDHEEEVDYPPSYMGLVSIQEWNAKQIFYEEFNFINNKETKKSSWHIHVERKNENFVGTNKDIEEYLLKNLNAYALNVGEIRKLNDRHFEYLLKNDLSLSQTSTCTLVQGFFQSDIACEEVRENFKKFILERIGRDGRNTFICYLDGMFLREGESHYFFKIGKCQLEWEKLCKNNQFEINQVNCPHEIISSSKNILLFYDDNMPIKSSVSTLMLFERLSKGKIESATYLPHQNCKRPTNPIFSLK
jgi:hypothetical protein